MPIAPTLHLTINFHEPPCKDAPIICGRKCLPLLGKIGQLRSLRLDLVSDPIVIDNDTLSAIHKHLPKLQKLEIAYEFYSEPHALDGGTILRYIESAKHLTELKLCSTSFKGIRLNDFYARALEIVEKRANALPLKIYHRGETIVQKNSLKLLECSD